LHFTWWRRFGGAPAKTRAIMMMTKANAAPIRFYAGLYLRTQRQTRFWGWSSWGWGKLRAIEAERPWAGLASWLRQAHARLDGNPALLAPSQTGLASAPAQLLSEGDEPQPRRQPPKPQVGGDPQLSRAVAVGA